VQALGKKHLGREFNIGARRAGIRHDELLEHGPVFLGDADLERFAVLFP
jgi:hypothetical protein